MGLVQKWPGHLHIHLWRGLKAGEVVVPSGPFLLLGHGAFNTYLYRFCLNDVTVYACDGISMETSWHVLLDRPLHAWSQSILTEALYTAGVAGSWSVSKDSHSEGEDYTWTQREAASDCLEPRQVKSKLCLFDNWLTQQSASLVRAALTVTDKWTTWPLGRINAFRSCFHAGCTRRQPRQVIRQNSLGYTARGSWSDVSNCKRNSGTWVRRGNPIISVRIILRTVKGRETRWLGILLLRKIGNRKSNPSSTRGYIYRSWKV